MHEDTDRELLARVDERTKRMEGDIHTIYKKMSSGYVTKEQFNPVKNIVFGLAGAVLMSVLAMILTGKL